MNDLYWISVLGSLETVVCTVCFLTVIACVITTITYFVIQEDGTSDKVVLGVKRIAIGTFCTFLFTVTLDIFLPTKDELYCIYGVGQTIDYLKSNKEAKQLPDKAIKALNFYLDNQVKQDSINNK